MSQLPSDSADGWDAFGDSAEDSTSVPLPLSAIPATTATTTTTQQQSTSSSLTVAPSSSSTQVVQDQAEDEDWFGEFATALPTPAIASVTSTGNVVSSSTSHSEAKVEPLSTNEDWDDFNSGTPPEIVASPSSLAPPVPHTSSDVVENDDAWEFNSATAGGELALPSTESEQVTTVQDSLDSTHNHTHMQHQNSLQTSIQGSHSANEHSDSSTVVHDSSHKVETESEEQSEFGDFAGLSAAKAISEESDFGEFLTQAVVPSELSTQAYDNDDNIDSSTSQTNLHQSEPSSSSSSQTDSKWLTPSTDHNTTPERITATVESETSALDEWSGFDQSATSSQFTQDIPSPSSISLPSGSVGSAEHFGSSSSQQETLPLTASSSHSTHTHKDDEDRNLTGTNTPAQEQPEKEGLLDNLDESSIIHPTNSSQVTAATDKEQASHSADQDETEESTVRAVDAVTTRDLDSRNHQTTLTSTAQSSVAKAPEKMFDENNEVKLSSEVHTENAHKGRDEDFSAALNDTSHKVSVDTSNFNDASKQPAHKLPNPSEAEEKQSSVAPSIQASQPSASNLNSLSESHERASEHDTDSTLPIHLPKEEARVDASSIPTSQKASDEDDFGDFGSATLQPDATSIHDGSHNTSTLSSDDNTAEDWGGDFAAEHVATKEVSREETQSLVTSSEEATQLKASSVSHDLAEQSNETHEPPTETSEALVLNSLTSSQALEEIQNTPEPADEPSPSSLLYANSSSNETRNKETDSSNLLQSSISPHLVSNSLSVPSSNSPSEDATLDSLSQQEPVHSQTKHSEVSDAHPAYFVSARDNSSSLEGFSTTHGSTSDNTILSEKETVLESVPLIQDTEANAGSFEPLVDSASRESAPSEENVVLESTASAQNDELTIIQAREEIPLQDEQATEGSSQSPETQDNIFSSATVSASANALSPVAAAFVEAAFEDSEFGDFKTPETPSSQPTASAIAKENVEPVSAGGNDEWGDFAQTEPAVPESITAVTDEGQTVRERSIPAVIEQVSTENAWNEFDDSMHYRDRDALVPTLPSASASLDEPQTASHSTKGAIADLSNKEEEWGFGDATNQSTTAITSSSTSLPDNSSSSNSSSLAHVNDAPEVSELSTHTSEPTLASSPSSLHQQQEQDITTQQVSSSPPISPKQDSSTTTVSSTITSATTRDAGTAQTNFEDDDWGGFAEASGPAETPKVSTTSLSTRAAIAAEEEEFESNARSSAVVEQTSATLPPPASNDEEEWGDFGKPEEDEPISSSHSTTTTVPPTPAAATSTAVSAPAEDDDWGEFGTAPVSSAPSSSSSSTSTTVTATNNNANDDEDSEWGGFGTAEKAMPTAPTPAVPVAAPEPVSAAPERKVAGITMTILLTLPADQFVKKVEECVAELFGPEPHKTPTPAVIERSKLHCSKCQEPRPPASNMCLYCGQRFHQITMPQFKGSWLEKSLYENLGLPPPLTQEIPVEDQIEGAEEEQAKTSTTTITTAAATTATTTAATIATTTAVTPRMPSATSSKVPPPMTPSRATTTEMKTAASLPTMSMTLDSFLSGEDDEPRTKPPPSNKASKTGNLSSPTATSQNVASVIASLPDYKFMLFTEVKVNSENRGP